jgi:hypothetical protein
MSPYTIHSRDRGTMIMGQSIFPIEDKWASFGLESPRVPTRRTELHLTLSKGGAELLLEAISSVSERRRKSTIVINCGECAPKRTFKFFKRVAFLVPPVESEAEELKFESEESAASVTLPRSHLATAVEMSHSLLAGNYDVSFEFGDKIRIWVWGNGYGP